MLEAFQTYTHPDGRVLTIGYRMDDTQAIGEVFIGTLTFGPLTVGIVVTAEGVADAGYRLQEPEPEPELEPEVEHQLELTV